MMLLDCRSGFHKPRVVAEAENSLLRASSPRNEQGGRTGLLIEGIWQQGEMTLEALPFTPESSASVVGLSTCVSDPTAPSCAAFQAVPSLRSARVGGSLMPLASAHPSTTRWRSAHADDARSAFPLDLLPSRDKESLARQEFIRDDLLASLLTSRQGGAPHRG